MWALFYLRNTALKFFLQGYSSFLRNNVCKTDSVFQAAPGPLNEKQKKHYYLVEQQTGRLFIVYSTEFLAVFKSKVNSR